MPVSISVVTPSYNQAQYLEETIRSVVSQRDQVHEYFVIDGGSKDGSVDVIKRYAGQIDHWVSDKDEGQSDAIRKGFARATGDVICWLNSDDVFLPGTLEKVRRAFDRNPHWDVLTGYCVLIDAETRILRITRSPREGARWASWGVLHACQQACFFRRSLYERVGGVRQDLHYMMDSELWMRFFEAGAVWGHVPDYLACFRLQAASKSISQSHSWAPEFQQMAPVHPRYYPPPWRRSVGIAAYRLQQIVSGRWARAFFETRRSAGRKLTDVFGGWVTEPSPRGEHPVA